MLLLRMTTQMTMGMPNSAVIVLMGKVRSLDNTGHIRNFCGIVGSINAEVFKKNLAKVIDDSMQVYKELERVIFQRA